MFWPDNAQIAVTTSLMFEAGSQDLHKTFGPFPVAQEGDFPDLFTNSWFDYAANEGIPRVLDLFDRHGVTASSFMTGMSVERYPPIAREIVKRGHEAAAHGRRWAPSFNMAPGEEEKFIADGFASVERTTGQRPVGWNAHSMRNSVNTLEILQQLDFIYFIEISATTSRGVTHSLATLIEHKGKHYDRPTNPAQAVHGRSVDPQRHRSLRR